MKKIVAMLALCACVGCGQVGSGSKKYAVTHYGTRYVLKGPLHYAYANNYTVSGVDATTGKEVLVAGPYSVEELP